MASYEMFIVILTVAFLHVKEIAGINMNVSMFLSENNMTERFLLVAKAYWDDRLEEFPTKATQLGVHKFDHILEEYTETAFERRKNRLPALMARDNLLSDVTNNVYYGPIKHALPDINDTIINSEVKERIRNCAVHIVNTSVIPALKRLKTFIVEEYIPQSRSSIGLGSYTKGAEYYEAILQYLVKKNVTAAEIRDIGMKEMDRIRGLMTKIMVDEGFNGTLKEFFEYLPLERKEFYNQTQEELVAEYKTIIKDRVKPRLPQIFHKLQLPSQDVNVRGYAYDGAPGGYMNNVFWVNIRHAEARPKFLMMSVALHEADPGHHLQVKYAETISSLAFRQTLWTGKQYSAPFNTPYFSSYVEGWGLYAEYIGGELGLYNKTRLEHMTRDDAIAYLSNSTAMPPAQIIAEIDRYITWPGQALVYKMGEMTIHKLRNTSEERLGSRFNVKDFHAAILDAGRVPLDLLESQIYQWINETLSTD